MFRQCSMIPYAAIVVFLTGSLSSKVLRLTPGNVDHIEGRILIADCNVRPNFTGKYNASNLGFKFHIYGCRKKDGGYPGDKDKCINNVDENNTAIDDDLPCDEVPSPPYETVSVNSSNIRRVNPFKIRMTYPNVTRRFDNGALVCYVHSRGVSLDICAVSHIVVGSLPSVPTIGGFAVKNWNEFKFGWTLPTADDDGDLVTTYDGWYKIYDGRRDRDDDFVRCRRDSTASSCVVDVSLNSSIVVKVIATNMLGSVDGAEVTVENLYEIVQPNVVRSVAAAVSDVSSSLCLSFPSPNPGHELRYEAEFLCDGDRYRQTFVSSLDFVKDCFTPDLLPPYSPCDASVRARPVGYGRWGGWSDRQEFRSAQKVPLVAPRLCRSCVELLTSDVVYDGRDVVVYFKPLAEKEARGRVKEYRVVVVDENGSRELRTFGVEDASGGSVMLRNLSWTSDYRLTVDAATDAGYNDRLKDGLVIRLPSSATLPARARNFTAIVVDDATVRLSWLRVDDDDSVITVFWCERRITLETMVFGVNNCKSPLFWQEIAAGVGHHDVRLLGTTFSSVRDYFFGVANETADGYTSGIDWATCLYDRSLVSRSPSITVRTADSRTVLTLDDACRGGGYPYAYVVHYCALVNNRTFCSADEPLRTRTVNRPSNDIVLTDLIADRKYLLVVSSVSVAGPSLANVSQTFLAPPSSSDESKSAKTWIAVGVVLGVLFVVSLVLLFLRFLRSSFWKEMDIEVPSRSRGAEEVGGSYDSLERTYQSAAITGASGNDSILYGAGHLPGGASYDDEVRFMRNENASSPLLDDLVVADDEDSSGDGSDSSYAVTRLRPKTASEILSRRATEIGCSSDGGSGGGGGNLVHSLEGSNGSSDLPKFNFLDERKSLVASTLVINPMYSPDDSMVSANLVHSLEGSSSSSNESSAGYAVSKPNLGGQDRNRIYSSDDLVVNSIYSPGGDNRTSTNLVHSPEGSSDDDTASVDYSAVQLREEQPDPTKPAVPVHSLDGLRIDDENTPNLPLSVDAPNSETNSVQSLGGAGASDSLSPSSSGGYAVVNRLPRPPFCSATTDSTDDDNDINDEKDGYSSSAGYAVGRIKDDLSLNLSLLSSTPAVDLVYATREQAETVV